MKLKQLRLINNLTQEELAKKVNLTQFTYSNYENEKTQPDFETIIKIANYYNVSIDYLLDYKSGCLIDTSTYSNTKKDLLNLIVKQNDSMCDKLQGVVYGYIESYNQTKDFIEKNKFNKFNN